MRTNYIILLRNYYIMYYLLMHLPDFLVLLPSSFPEQKISPGLFLLLWSQLAVSAFVVHLLDQFSFFLYL